MSNTTANPPLDEEYDSTGFISYQLSTLPIGLRAILSLLCIVIGLGLCTLSPYAARWGTHWGVKNNDTEVREEIDGKKSFKFRLGGGVLGIFTGALGAGESLNLQDCQEDRLLHLNLMLI